MVKRKNARELVLKLLFQIDVGKLPVDEVLENALEEVRPSPEDWSYVVPVVHGVLAECETLDRTIDDLAKGWRLERLARVDKNVLRAALWELDHSEDQTPSAIINDAVDIAKKFSTEDSGRFVNGILGSYLRSRGSSEAEDAEQETSTETSAEMSVA
jgi:N utilization substance protein B